MMNIDTAIASGFPASDTNISNACKMMNDAFLATKDICMKLRQMSEKTRTCCDTLDRIIETSMNFQMLSKGLVEKIFITSAGLDNNSQTASDRRSAYTDDYICFIEDNLDQACKLFDRGLDEIYGRIEELSYVQTDMDDTFSELSENNDEYLEAVHLIIRQMAQNQSRVQDISKEN